MRVPYRGSVFMNAQKRVDAMDALGIDLQLLSPNPLSEIISEVNDDPFPEMQAQNTQLLDSMVKRMSQLEAIAESVAGINATLKRAAQVNGPPDYVPPARTPSRRSRSRPAVRRPVLPGSAG